MIDLGKPRWPLRAPLPVLAEARRGIPVFSPAPAGRVRVRGLRTYAGGKRSALVVPCGGVLLKPGSKEIIQSAILSDRRQEGGGTGGYTAP